MARYVDIEPLLIKLSRQFNKTALYLDLMESPTTDIREVMNSAWIPVTERLPQNGEKCLVTRYDYVTKTPFVDLLWFDNDWWDRLNSGDYAVTHWMPMPEPYRCGK